MGCVDSQLEPQNRAHLHEKNVAVHQNNITFQRDSIPLKNTTELKSSSIKTGNFPNSIITDKHLRFFYKYGFMLIRGLHSKEMTEEAARGAEYLIQEDKKAIDGGKGQQAFSGLPEGKRSTWGRCEEPRLMKYFTFQQNMNMCRDIVGEFQFKHHPGPGYYTFAPRFFQWAKDPNSKPKNNHAQTVKPFDMNNLPSNLTKWEKNFLKNADQLGVKLAPTVHNNWHLDGEDYKSISGFSILWGSYINSLPEGEMGNLLVYPGTHHVMADIFRKKGAIFHYDGKVEKPKPKPELRKEGIAEGKGYSLCVESGDIIFAHPWLAHGIGQNNSDQTRLAVYCRLHSPGFWMPGGGRSKMAGTHVGFTKGMPDQPKLWTGDPWANVTNINPWIKANSEFLSSYDNGQLEDALKKL